jgi:hypothetical protein
MTNKAIIRLSKDLFIGTGKKKVLFGSKGDAVEIENYGRIEDGMFMAQHKTTREKLIVKKQDL